ncbi:MAG: replicative DNA helicase [Chitinispirillaceae bacterium]|nr:replicative DNA helicase [Chitinispirillaceae bacterium]
MALRNNPSNSPAHSAERIPPQALDVERTVLGSMLIDDRARESAFELLNENSFYSGANRKIFACMLEMSEKNVPVDLVTLKDALVRKQLLEAVGDETYLAELAESIATSANMEYYAKILREKETLRQLISSAAQITTDCFNTEIEAQELLDKAEQAIFGISESRIKNKFEKVKDLLPRTFEEIAAYSTGGFQGIRTGFDLLDEQTTGLKKGDLVVVAARPSMGKTAFCLSIAQRMICAEARVNMHMLQSGKLSKRDFPKLSMAAGPLAEAPLYIDDTPAITVMELRTKARRLKMQYGLDLIIVDYLQIMGSNVKVENRQQEISQMSRQLKAVAKELDVPLIVLSQLSRAPEQRTGDHRPKLSDLRESGAIEQDADLVMFIYRDEVYNKEIPEEEKGIAEIIIGKQRNGPIGTVKLAFIADYARFDNLSGRTEAEHGF